jgi:DNA-binding transcriptional LysR family regulator
VKQSSWSKAASELGVAQKELTRTVARLEQRLGVELLDRTAAEVRLTAAGIEFHARTRQALDELAKVEAALQKTEVKPNGTVRINAPVVLGQSYVAPLIKDLRRAYPELAIELALMDRFVVLIHENFDLAIRVGSPFDSRLMVRRLCQNRRVLVASPEYLERQGTPARPEELTEHDCILFTSFSNQNEWTLMGPDGPVTVAVSGMLSTNNGYVMNTLAEQGQGITFGPTLALAPALLAGRLVRVLPEYEMSETSVFAAYPSTQQLPPRVNAVVEFLAQRLVDPPAWDRQLSGRIAGF